MGHTFWECWCAVSEVWCPEIMLEKSCVGPAVKPRLPAIPLECFRHPVRLSWTLQTNPLAATEYHWVTSARVTGSRRIILESPAQCPTNWVHSEGDQPWVYFGRNDAKAETPVLWPSHTKSWLIGKDSDAGRDWGQEEKEPTEDEMAGWHHRLDGHEFEWTPGVDDGQGGLACCDLWGCKELDTTEQLKWTELKPKLYMVPRVLQGWGKLHKVVYI